MLNNDDTNQIKPGTKEQTLHLLKFHSWLAYLPELGYDVAIKPSLNVPSNSDFESFLGEFG